MIKLYHGSDHVLKYPQYMGGKDDNDYGNGFYTTEYPERAESWAALNGNPKKSIVNMYELNTDDLMILDLNNCGVLAWIAEVAANRGTTQEAAAIVGKRIVARYRADTAEYDLRGQFQRAFEALSGRGVSAQGRDKVRQRGDALLYRQRGSGQKIRGERGEFLQPLYHHGSAPAGGGL